MQYPLISEYVEAIRSAEDNFDKLNYLRPVLDNHGNPVMSSGNFAAVFKMQSVRDGKTYALKCFTKEQEGRGEAYRLISDELEMIQSTYLAHVEYLEKELFVDTNSSGDSEFPVLLMDWVDGMTLDRYILRNIHDRHVLEMLAYNFSRLAMWILPQPFAHGDLKPDNILVQADGSLVLVDYDGMYVPAMQGQKSRELGSPDFRHPLRTEDDFNEHIDDFPAISILLSLKLIAENPNFINVYGASDRLLFSENDYRNLKSCALLKNIFPSENADINALVAIFTIANIRKTLSQVSFRLLAIEKPKKDEVAEEILSTEVTEADLAEAIVDEFGAKYSKDGKRLLKVANISHYKIREGTKIICDDAFCWCSLQSVEIPNSVTTIGKEAFSECRSLQSVEIPNSVRTIGDNAFFWCTSLKEIIIPSSVKSILGNPFANCKCNVENYSPHFIIKDGVLYDSCMNILIACLSPKTTFAIPNSVTTIGGAAFYECYSLQSVEIPNSVTSIGIGAFYYCTSLQSVEIPNSVTTIGKEAFSGCESLRSISIPNSVTTIGDSAFELCLRLQSIEIPNSVTTIGDNAFSDCKSLQSVEIPNSVTTIGGAAFSDCKSLQSVEIPNSVTTIGYSAFSRCTSLCSISIPNSVTTIGNYTFSMCYSLQSVEIPNSVTTIGNYAFCMCRLPSVEIPNSVTTIGNSAFSRCTSLREIIIPAGSRAKFENLLPEHKSILVEK